MRYDWCWWSLMRLFVSVTGYDELCTLMRYDNRWSWHMTSFDRVWGTASMRYKYGICQRYDAAWCGMRSFDRWWGFLRCEVGLTMLGEDPWSTMSCDEVWQSRVGMLRYDQESGVKKTEEVWQMMVDEVGWGLTKHCKVRKGRSEFRRHDEVWWSLDK